MCLPTDPMWNSVRSVTGTRNGSEAYPALQKPMAWPSRTTVTATPATASRPASSRSLAARASGTGGMDSGLVIACTGSGIARPLIREATPCGDSCGRAADQRPTKQITSPQ